MKNSLNKFLEKLAGTNSSYKEAMILYYGVFLFLSLMAFFGKGNGSNIALGAFLIFLAAPLIIVGFKKRKTFNKNEKINYIIYPMVFIFIISINMGMSLNKDNKIKNDALEELGINESTYKDTIEKYEQLKIELNNNKINENDYKLAEDNYKNLQSSYESLKEETAKKQEAYDELVQKKAEKEEKERIAKAEAERKVKEEAERKAKEEAEKVRIAKEKEAQAKKESSNNNKSSNKKSGTFKPSGGTASHDNRTGYDSPDSDPNEPVVTSDYGYIASGNNYIHKTPNCKFIRGKSASKVSVSASGKHTCNCWYY